MASMPAADAAAAPTLSAPRRPITLVGRRQRVAGVVLALLVEVAFVVMWITQTKLHGAPAHAGNPDAYLVLNLLPLEGSGGGGKSGPGPHRKRPARTPAKDKAANDQKRKETKAPQVIPAPNVITQPPLEKPPEQAPEQPPEQPKEPPAPEKKEPEEITVLSGKAADDFARQWSQLQNDIQKRAIEDVGRQHPKLENSEMAQTSPRDKAIQDQLAEHGQKSTDRRPESLSEESIFAGELCVTGTKGERDIQLALPCVGNDYITDFGWYSRVRAPKRGETMPRPVDPAGRVFVRNHVFGPATMAAFEEASAELSKIEVTVRMVYLPDLRYPIQLLSRDHRANAVAVEAFSTEEELADYLRQWAGNVHRWTTPPPGSADPNAPRSP